MAEYFSRHPDHALVFAFACFALTVYLFRYVGPRVGARGDWSARLEEVVADIPGPVVLAAHSLGCIATTLL